MTPRRASPEAARPEPESPKTEDFLPAVRTLPTLRQAAAVCRGCPLHLKATQTVFGEGPQTACVIAVGEQPGDYEDRQGRPFVGSAGRILDKALAEAGLDRGTVYVTNAVKHFTFEERGKSRLHKKPRQSDVRACNPWLRAELETIRPDLLLLLGSTAAQAVFGPAFRVTKERGKPLTSDLAPVVIATVHPSSVLRAPDDTSRHEAYRLFVSDLEAAGRELRKRPSR